MSSLNRQISPLRVKSAHQQRVEAFLVGHGRPVPNVPELASPELLQLWSRLLLEETLETIEAAGVQLVIDGDDSVRVTMDDFQFKIAHQPDLPKLAKETADVSVVNTGFMSLCGIADEAVLKAVDDNNFLKLSTGRFCPATGKLLKAPNHPKPDIKALLHEQGLP